MRDEPNDGGVQLLMVAVCCAVGLIYWWWVTSSRGGSRPPPGPRGLPIIGNLHQLGQLPHQTLARLSQTHGPLMSLRLGSVPLLVASSPHAAKLVLHTHDKLFAGRPVHMSAPTRIMGPGAPNILFQQPGPYWKLMRQICVSDFFSNKRLEHFRSVRMGEVRAMLASVLSLQGSAVCIRDKLHTATSNIICTMALGKPVHQFISADPSELNLTTVLMDAKSALGNFELGDYIPGLAWLDLEGCRKRDRQVARNAHSVIQKVIDTRRQERAACNSDPPRDFLDLLLATSEDAKYEDLHVEDANIRAVLLDMFVAGTDTSVVSIEWALAELFVNTDKLRRLQQELREVVGVSRIVEESDLPNLPYLRAVVNEAMRLHPVGPLLVPHRLLEPCEMEGYRIPANTVAYVNVWAIHRDPSAWENPSEFRPERFLDSALLDALPGLHYEFLPFGSGRRSCPAWKLGLLTVQTMLANLIHAFDWSTLPAGKPISLTEKFGLAVALEEPLLAEPTARLHREAYDTGA